MSLHKKTDKELMNLLHNTMIHPDRDRAEAKKSEVYKVWSWRNKSFSSGHKLPTMPWDGVLSAFGYRVGDHGISSASRRQLILNHIIEAPIPPVKNPQYLRDWGLPSSIKRKRKLKNTLKALYKGTSKRSTNRDISYEKAIKHWKEDLDYVTQKCA